MPYKIIEQTVRRVEPYTFGQYRELRQKLWLLKDKRIFFFTCIPVETGATPSEIANILKDSVKTHISKDGRRYATTFVHDASKRVIKKIKKKNEKEGTIITQARARDIVFNSDLTAKVLDYIGYNSSSQYLLPKIKHSGSTKLKNTDSALTRAGIAYLLKNSPVQIPFNLHQVKNGKQGGRHLFKQFTRAALIPKKMYSESFTRIMMGHAPRDSDEGYASQVDIDLAFLIVENTFVEP